MDSWLRIRSDQLAAHLVLAGHRIVSVKSAFYFERCAERDLERFTAALAIVRAERARGRASCLSLNAVFTPRAPEGGAR